jgi:hypothetical protein
LLLLVLVGELVDSCSEARGQFGNPLAEDLWRPSEDVNVCVTVTCKMQSRVVCQSVKSNYHFNSSIVTPYAWKYNDRYIYRAIKISRFWDVARNGNTLSWHWHIRLFYVPINGELRLEYVMTRATFSFFQFRKRINLEIFVQQFRKNILRFISRVAYRTALCYEISSFGS